MAKSIKLSVIYSLLCLFISFSAQAKIVKNLYDISLTVAYPSNITFETMQAFSDEVESMRQMEEYESYYGGPTTKRTLYTQSGNTYIYKDSYEETRFFAYNEGYAYHQNGCMRHPQTDITIKVTPTQLTFTIVEEIQLDSDANEYTGDPKKPKDPLPNFMDCKTGTRNQRAPLKGNGRSLICPFTATCTHSMKRVNIGGFAPWRVKHSQTITISLTSMAKENGLTIEELVWELLKGKLDYVPLFVKDDAYTRFDLSEETSIVLAHFLWKTSNIQKRFNDKALAHENEAIRLLEQKEYKKAQDEIKKAIEIAQNDKRIDLYYKIIYENLCDKEQRGTATMADYASYYYIGSIEPYKSLIAEKFLTQIKNHCEKHASDFLNGLNFNSSLGEMLASLWYTRSETAYTQAQQRINEIRAQRDAVATELARNFSKTTPIELIDSAQYTVYSNDAGGYVKESAKLYKNNYKNSSNTYFETDGVWYKVLPSGYEVEVSINRSKEYRGNVKVPDVVKHKNTVYKVIGVSKWAFFNCSNLKSITLPSTIKYIGKEAFFACNNLTSISIPDNVNSIGQDCFAQCEALERVTLPSNTATIPNGCFYKCNLKEITIPEGVKTIGIGAFAYNKNLSTATIASTVTEIGANAFINSKEGAHLTITLKSTPPSMVVIGVIPPKYTISVPQQFQKDYLLHDSWCTYKNITVR